MTDATDWLMIALGILLTAGTALFVSGEFSLVALDPSTVETRAAAGDRRAAAVRKALRRLSTLLSGAQVGITLTTILLGYTMQDALARLLDGLMSTWLAQSAATAAAVVIALVVVNAFSMVVGELIPKNATLADPMRTAGLVAPFLVAFTVVLRPVIVLLNDTANLVLHRMGIEPVEEISGTRSAGELAALVRHSAEEGALDPSTATLLTRSIGLGALTAVDVMTDRGRLHVLDEADTADAVVALARTTGHSRFPVIGESPDAVPAQSTAHADRTRRRSRRTATVGDDDVPLDGSIVVGHPKSRTATHWAGALVSIIALPVTWFFLHDGAAMATVRASGSYAFDLSARGLTELAIGALALIIAMWVARRTSVGSIIVGVISILLGLPFLIAPGVMTDTFTPFLNNLSTQSALGQSLSTYLWTDAVTGKFLALGLFMVMVGVVSHSARRAGRHEQEILSRADGPGRADGED